MASSPPRRRLVGVSTKMYFSAAQTKQYVSNVVTKLSESPDLLSSVDVFVIPDHLTMASVVAQLESTKTASSIMVGAQDAFWEDAGAYTGEVSPSVLAELGCRIVELGHAERRREFGETDASTAKKAAAAARNGLIPLVCIGERSRGVVSMAVGECATQVEAVMRAVPHESEVVLAYEPVWAIGAAEPASPEHVIGVVESIRGLPCVQKRDKAVRIIYGGSAGPGLFEKLKDAADGLFLGRFAHDPQAFVKTIREVSGA
ncbi:mitochondrial triosephosphate isomerase [Cryphonectria parasitica EP155]|uniref:Triosephosphate isomerase n=1 Tax=Cryphonectria parasitica (strain ATCC 38755 / EP155) TaxID=660469 RepID=A0A9P4Y4W3_CRYP1|nr:mitochondrial triosephosphate isomerase [Cryphonectria parasitica EP155]KAF3766711.1 mitochondrial triosephosphate isomerase [Cryphonectria parasitica EP155]